ncbi:hypothetical protein E7T06_06290 [Deinococcus sp. Arct2-2]|uniref:hypothetical protein n=1 Tax=Deinococcus sp. Arct2-2 TaxID=2568653 RepID=UPI0010A35E10|nr:hypothetical protein [Deinococcus sp. Arct2-2]THF70739.1 hypothetical protein E7T06_06290 [Deinococcus sp. Arct2-2]
MNRLGGLMLMGLGMAAAQAGMAVGVDYLVSLRSDGVFRQISPVKSTQSGGEESAYALQPDALGGQWILNLRGGRGNLAGEWQLSYLPQAGALKANADAAGRLLSRMAARAGAQCFGLSTAQLPALDALIRESVRLGITDEVNRERQLGTVRARVLVHHNWATVTGSKATDSKATDSKATASADRPEVDIFLNRSGVPEAGAWKSACRKV